MVLAPEHDSLAKPRSLLRLLMIGLEAHGHSSLALILKQRMTIRSLAMHTLAVASQGPSDQTRN